MKNILECHTVKFLTLLELKTVMKNILKSPLWRLLEKLELTQNLFFNQKNTNLGVMFPEF